jgi:hypothetical protein
MDPLLGIPLLLLAGGGLYHALRGAGQPAEPPTRPAPPPRVTRPARPDPSVKARRDRDAQSRAFQTALLQLAAAPDFRRAASLAAAAALVPGAFKRRQFARFRPRLVELYRRSAAAGGDAGALLRSLRDLVVALGVAAFEADYIRAEADRTSVRPAAPGPADRLAALKRDHDARVAAIREGLGQNPDLLEQLLEAEEGRYRQALESLFDAPPAGQGGVPNF